MAEQRLNLPMVPLRGLTIMPEMIVHFDVSRESSIAAVQEAMAEEQKIFLVSQKSIETEKPTQEDVFEIGTIATVKQIMKLPKQIMRVLVEGEVRGRLINMSDDAPYLQAEVEIIEDDEAMPETLDDQAMLRGLKDIFVEYAAKEW